MFRPSPRGREHGVVGVFVDMTRAPYLRVRRGVWPTTRVAESVPCFHVHTSAWKQVVCRSLCVGRDSEAGAMIQSKGVGKIGAGASLAC